MPKIISSPTAHFYRYIPYPTKQSPSAMAVQVRAYTQNPDHAEQFERQACQPLHKLPPVQQTREASASAM